MLRKDSDPNEMNLSSAASRVFQDSAVLASNSVSDELHLLADQAKQMDPALNIVHDHIVRGKSILAEDSLENTDKSDTGFGLILKTAVSYKMADVVKLVALYPGSERELPSAIHFMQVGEEKGWDYQGAYQALIEALAGKENLVFTGKNKERLQAICITMIERKEEKTLVQLMVPNILRQVDMNFLLSKALQENRAHVAINLIAPAVNDAGKAIHFGATNLLEALKTIQGMYGTARWERYWKVVDVVDASESVEGYEEVRQAIVAGITARTLVYQRSELVQLSDILLTMIESNNAGQGYRTQELAALLGSQAIRDGLYAHAGESDAEPGEVLSLNKLMRKALDHMHGDAMILLLQHGATNYIDILNCMQQRATPPNWIAGWISFVVTMAAPLDMKAWKTGGFSAVYAAVSQEIKDSSFTVVDTELPTLVQVVDGMIRREDEEAVILLQADCAKKIATADVEKLSASAHEMCIQTSKKDNSFKIGLELTKLGNPELMTSLEMLQQDPAKISEYGQSFYAEVVGKLTESDAVHTVKKRLLIVLDYMLVEGHPEAQRLLKADNIKQTITDEENEGLLARAIEVKNADIAVLLIDDQRSSLALNLLNAQNGFGEVWVKGSYEDVETALVIELTKASCQIRNERERTALVEALKLLIENGRSAATKMIRAANISAILTAEEKDELLEFSVKARNSDSAILLIDTNRRHLPSCLVEAQKGKTDSWVAGDYGTAAKELALKMVKTLPTHQSKNKAVREGNKYAVPDPELVKFKEAAIFMAHHGEMNILSGLLEDEVSRSVLPIRKLITAAIEDRQGECLIALLNVDDVGELKDQQVLAAGQTGIADALAAVLSSPGEWASPQGTLLDNKQHEWGLSCLLAQKLTDLPEVREDLGSIPPKSIQLDPESEMALAKAAVALTIPSFDNDEERLKKRDLIFKNVKVLNKIMRTMLVLFLQNDQPDEAFQLVQPLARERQVGMLLFVIHKMQVDVVLTELTPASQMAYEKILSLLKDPDVFKHFGEPYHIEHYPGAGQGVLKVSEGEERRVFCANRDHLLKVTENLVVQDSEGLGDINKFLSLEHFRSRVSCAALLRSTVGYKHLGFAKTLFMNIKEEWHIIGRELGNTFNGKTYNVTAGVQQQIQQKYSEILTAVLDALRRSLALDNLDELQEIANFELRGEIVNFLSTANRRDTIRTYVLKDKSNADKLRGACLDFARQGETNHFTQLVDQITAANGEILRENLVACLRLALQFCHTEIVGYLHGMGTKLSSVEQNNAVVDAVQKNNAEMLKYLLAADSSLLLNQRVRSGVGGNEVSLLVYALRKNYVAVAEQLITYGLGKSLDQDYKGAYEYLQKQKATNFFSRTFTSAPQLSESTFSHLSGMAFIVASNNQMEALVDDFTDLTPPPVVDEEEPRPSSAPPDLRAGGIGHSKRK